MPFLYTFFAICIILILCDSYLYIFWELLVFDTSLTMQTRLWLSFFVFFRLNYYNVCLQKDLLDNKKKNQISGTCQDLFHQYKRNRSWILRLEQKERINMNSERILLCTFCQYTLLGNNYNNDNNNNEYHPSTTINEYKDVLFKI